MKTMLCAIAILGWLSGGLAQAAVLAYWNFGDAIAQDQYVEAAYEATTAVSGFSVSDIQFESGWTVIADQVDTRLGSTSLTVGSQTFDSSSSGTYVAITDDAFTINQYQVSNEGDNRNNSNPGKAMLQLLTPGQNISDIAESRASNLGFGLTVTASSAPLRLSSLVLQAARYDNNPQRSWETIALYADTGSGQFLVDTQGPTPVDPLFAPVTFDLSALAYLTDGDSVTLRMYGDNGTGGDNTFGRELWIDDITLNGSLIPEPATMGLLGLGTLISLMARRQRSMSLSKRQANNSASVDPRLVGRRL